MKTQSLVIACLLVSPLAALSQVTVFNDNFSSGSTLDSSNPVPPTATSSSYEEIASKTWSPNPPTIATGSLEFGTVKTSGGGDELQALITTNPVTLVNPGDYIKLTVTFTDVNILSLTNDTQLGMGLFNAGQVLPFGGGLNDTANDTSSNAILGHAQNWVSDIAIFAELGGNLNSEFEVRPAQTNADNRDQVTEVTGSGIYGFQNGTTHSSSSARNVDLTAGDQYAEVLTYTLSTDSTSVIITASIYTNNPEGALLTTETYTNATPLTTTFDAFSIGWRSEDNTNATVIDLNSVQVFTSVGETCISESVSDSTLSLGETDGLVTITIPPGATVGGPLSVDLVSSNAAVAYPSGAPGGTLTVTFPQNSPYSSTNLPITVLEETGSTLFYLTNATEDACIQGEGNLITVSCDPITISPNGAISLQAGQNNQVLNVSIPSFANASGPVTVDLVSLNPSVVTPDGAVDGTLELTFPAAGTNSLSVGLDVLAEGTATLILSNASGPYCTSIASNETVVATVSCDPITISPTGPIVSLVGQTDQVLNVTIPSFANASGPVTVDLVSLSPSVVTPDGAVDGTLELTFPSAGTNSLSVGLDVLAEGTATLILTNGSGPYCTSIASNETVVVTVPETEGTNVMTETFDSQASASSDGWTDYMDQTNEEDYGWSDTQNAGGANAGEAGGSFVRDTNLSYYADITVGPLTLNDYISASGTLAIAPPSTDAAFDICYFNTNNANASSDNMLGFGLADGTYPNSRISAVVSTSSAGGSETHEVFGPVQLSADVSVPWSFSYDPTGGAGYGELTLDYTVSGTPYSTNVVLTAGDRNAGASFNAFGMMIRGVGGLDTTNVMGIYMDDVTYTKGYSIIPSSIPLQISYSGSNLMLTWTNAAFSLEFSTNVAGPYVVIPGATSPFTTNASGATAGFFRLVSP